MYEAGRYHKPHHKLPFGCARNVGKVKVVFLEKIKLDKQKSKHKCGKQQMSIHRRGKNIFWFIKGVSKHPMEIKSFITKFHSIAREKVHA